MGDTGHTCLEGPGPCPYCEWESLEEEVREQNAEIARLKAEVEAAGQAHLKMVTMYEKEISIFQDAIKRHQGEKL